MSRLLFYLYQVYKIGIFKRHFHRLKSTRLNGITCKTFHWVLPHWCHKWVLFLWKVYLSASENMNIFSYANWLELGFQYLVSVLIEKYRQIKTVLSVKESSKMWKICNIYLPGLLKWMKKGEEQGKLHSRTLLLPPELLKFLWLDSHHLSLRKWLGRDNICQRGNCFLYIPCYFTGSFWGSSASSSRLCFESVYLYCEEQAVSDNQLHN